MVTPYKQVTRSLYMRIKYNNDLHGVLLSPLVARSCDSSEAGSVELRGEDSVGPGHRGL